MLFLRECKKSVFSITFLLLTATVLLMVSSQDVLNFSDRKIEMPKAEQADYGMQVKEIPEIIMPGALASLYAEFSVNSYTAYPIGFYKDVKLNHKEQREMAEILSSLTGISADELLKAEGSISQEEGFTFGGGELIEQGEGQYTMTMTDEAGPNQNRAATVTLQAGISYEEFKTYMELADDIIGGGSRYGATYLLDFGRVPVTYDEALESYRLSKEKDRFTGAYARLFTDYLGIVLSILPVFLAVAVSLKDKTSKIKELIFTREASSAKIIITRYLAIMTTIMLPAVILSYISNISVWHIYKGLPLDYLAPLKYDLGWILPSVMVSAAVGMFLTELTNSPIAVAVQGAWWFIDINMGISEINGGYSLLRLTPRHNTLTHTQTLVDNFSSLVANRLLFTSIAMLLIAATVIIYEQKRRGLINGEGKIKRSIAAMANYKN